MNDEKSDIPIWEKINLTVDEAVRYSNIGENTLRRLLDEPNCSFVLFIRNRRLIKRKEFERWLAKQVFIK